MVITIYMNFPIRRSQMALQPDQNFALRPEERPVEFEPETFQF